MTRATVDPLVLEEGHGNRLEVVTYGSKTVNIDVENDWAGSTETGFGLNSSIELTKAQAATLVNYLAEWILST